MSSAPPSSVPFRERLRPSPGVHLVVAGLGVSLGLLVLPFSAVAAAVTAVVSALLLSATLAIGAPVVEVRSGELRAGRARIPLRLLGEAQVLDREGMRAALGPQADVRAWVCHRPWVHTGVRVPVTDPRDPAPYWLLGTRDPARLQAALGGATGGQAAHSEQIS